MKKSIIQTKLYILKELQEVFYELRVRLTYSIFEAYFNDKGRKFEAIIRKYEKNKSNLNNNHTCCRKMLIQDDNLLNSFSEILKSQQMTTKQCF